MFQKGNEYMKISKSLNKTPTNNRNSESLHVQTLQKEKLSSTDYLKEQRAKRKDINETEF